MSGAGTGLRALLRETTGPAHRQLDDRVAAADPFGDRGRYLGFLRMQHAFHRRLSPLYRRPDLGAHLPGLAARDRLPAIAADLADLGGETPASPAADASVSMPEALGWLYVAEGSTLGAAVLLRRAEALGLGAGFGARHLAPAPEGVARHWADFAAALDAVPLDGAGRQEAVIGAVAAFDTAAALAKQLLVVPAAR